jgi:signal transduction histidine kinase/CheY-like chemotaxis protein
MGPESLYAYCPSGMPTVAVVQILVNALAHVRLRQEHEETKGELARMAAEFQNLNAIGIRLSAESDTVALLDLILTKAREITQSDAGSLYLVEQDEGREPWLCFKLVQNDSFPVPFAGYTLPVDSRSVAGHVALSRHPLNLVDAYTPPPGSPFRIDRSYDDQLGYRSKSMLVVPMKNQKDETVGVLQLINCKPDWTRRYTQREEIERDVQPFPIRFQELACSLASQAAVALEKSRLWQELNEALARLEASKQQILQTERLRALGEIAGGVAHDFDNFLTVILGRTGLLLETVTDPDVLQHLRVIERAVLDETQTVRRILEFTRAPRTRPFERVDLNELVEVVMRATRRNWWDAAQAKGLSYDVRLETGPVVPIFGDPAELREALTHLVLNALDAMPEGGRLTLVTGREVEHVYCVVRDTGAGMTPEVQRRLFEPFFTTKGPRGGGLGLSVTYGIVTRHGGEIEVQSEPGVGSVFTVRLPVRPVVAGPESFPPEGRPEGLKVLVIDDEPRVGRILIELLLREGHIVVAADDGPSGLAKCESETFDLVISDLGMPGLSGWDVARLVKQKYPGTPVALVTGWVDRIAGDEARARHVDFLIAKPFTIDQILTVLGQVRPR